MFIKILQNPHGHDYTYYDSELCFPIPNYVLECIHIRWVVFGICRPSESTSSWIAWLSPPVITTTTMYDS